MDLSIVMLAYQRVNLQISPWNLIRFPFSHGFPMVFPVRPRQQPRGLTGNVSEAPQSWGHGSNLLEGSPWEHGMILSGWWWLEHVSWIFLFHSLGIIIPSDFHMFQRGWNHQPAVSGKIHHLGWLKRVETPERLESYRNCGRKPPLNWCRISSVHLRWDK